MIGVGKQFIGTDNQLMAATREDNTTSFRRILVLHQLEEKKKEKREIKKELDTLQTQRQTASQETPHPDIDAALRQQKDYREREKVILKKLVRLNGGSLKIP